MRRVRVGLLALLLVTASRSAHAQIGQQGWDVSIDFLQIATRGNDVHVGDVFTERQTFTGSLDDQRLDYGVEYEPIVTSMEANRSVMVAAVFRGVRWGGGARGWRSAAEGATEGADRSPTPTASSDAVTGIRMWDNSIVPVGNILEPSGFSPVTFHAANSLTTLRIEAFAERLWIGGSDLHVGARFGVAHARVENLRSEGQTQRAYFEDVELGEVLVFENDIALDGESEASMSLTGPMLALAGDATAGRLRIDWLVGQAVLLGTAETSGEWTDVDDIRRTILANPPEVSFELLSGLIEKEQDDRALVPVLDLQVKASVAVNRVLRLGGGVFSSTWFDLPVAPAFSVPDDWTDVQGTAWRQQTRNINFTAISVFAGLGF